MAPKERVMRLTCTWASLCFDYMHAPVQMIRQNKIAAASLSYPGYAFFFFYFR